MPNTDNFDGDVNLSSGDVVYLIPTPSPDLRGVNEPSIWRSNNLYN
jgi:hypothetical protein